MINTLTFDEFYNLFKYSNIFGLTENKFNEIDFINLIIFICSNGKHTTII